MESTIPNIKYISMSNKQYSFKLTPRWLVQRNSQNVYDIVDIFAVNVEK